MHIYLLLSHALILANFLQPRLATLISCMRFLPFQGKTHKLKNRSSSLYHWFKLANLADCRPGRKYLNNHVNRFTHKIINSAFPAQLQAIQRESLIPFKSLFTSSSSLRFVPFHNGSISSSLSRLQTNGARIFDGHSCSSRPNLGHTGPPLHFPLISKHHMNNEHCFTFYCFMHLLIF